MASFYANPDDANEPWIERSVSDVVRFRVWHVILFCVGALVILAILVCCCIKFRIPRTKQEIEADYQRKLIAAKFKQKLKSIQNQEMDGMDLQRALRIIQDDLRLENKNIDEILEMQNMPSKSSDC